MASLIPGYNYDIFISYRQKDNKHDSWVTEFVNQLKGELEATFKEDISIYFDENPHDGLLETHDVDKSLESKLKCLIFIPVISQTYCDSKSYAWQHEFCAFNKLAKEDQFGRDIRLTSGNVASRILPVKIHDLDPEDKALLETELSGVLRSVEFIYKEAGVNRPLKPDDDAKENLNKTHYINQVNKVANAVKEIVAALKKQNQHSEEALEEDLKTIPINKKSAKPKIIIGSLILLALVVLCYFFIPKILKPAEELEKSIAVLPFKLLSDEPDKQYQADGIMDAILLHLQKFKDLRVMPRTSVEQYQKTTKTAHVIGKELDVAYLLEGSFQKFGDNVKLIVQLINAQEESHVWANEYNNKWSEIFSVQSEVAQTIAKELHSVITPEEKQLINKIPTTNLNAYDLYLKANDYRKDYEKTRDINTYHRSTYLYNAAIELDSTFSWAYVGLAWTYFNRYFWPYYYKENFLDTCLVLANKALSFDDQLEGAYYLRGRVYKTYGHIEEALDNYDKTLEINPNYYYAYYARGEIFSMIKFDLVKAIDSYHKALKLMSVDKSPPMLRTLGGLYAYAGFIEKAKQYYQEALAMDGNKTYYFGALSGLEFDDGNFEEAFRLSEEANKIDSTYLGPMMYYDLASGHDEEVYKHALKLVAYYKKSGEVNYSQSYRIGYAFWKVSKFNDAEYYFNQQVKYSEEDIKLNRRSTQFGQSYLVLAITYAFKDDKIKAYMNLDELNKLNFFPLFRITLIKHDPMLASIRNEERFQTLLKSMESKYQAEHERVRKWLEEQGML